MRISACLTMAVLLFVTSTCTAQETSVEDFRKLCSDMEGRWVGDVTWITDWPGLGAKGDKVTAYWEGNVCQDGHLLVGNFFGGNGSETLMIYYDAVAKRTRWTSVSSGGSVTQVVIYPKDGNWIQVASHMLPDGTKGETESVGTITDGGKTWTWLHNGKIGDDVITDQKDVWRRVND